MIDIQFSYNLVSYIGELEAKLLGECGEADNVGL